MLADLIRRLRDDRRFDEIDRAYSHRAVREDGSAILHGREALRQAEVALAQGGPDPVVISTDLGDMVAWTGPDGGGHHWIWRNGDRIAREVLVRNRRCSPPIASPLHPALGELRAGQGQLAVDQEPVLPPCWPEGAVPHTRRLHQIWNMRAIGLIGDHSWSGPGARSGDQGQHRAWVFEVLRALPDAVMLFEHAVVTTRAVAVLWRLHGNHLGDGFGLPATGRRIRLFGSTIVSLAGDAVTGESTMIDEGDAIGQLNRPIVDYSRPPMSGDSAD